MKKIWSAPEAIAEQFAANEYVAACYIVLCDVPHGTALYEESNGTEGLQKNGTNADKKLWSSSWGAAGCDNWHPGVIRADAPEKNGYWVTGSNSYVEVFWWAYDYKDGSIDFHASESLKYETNPNAS